MAGSLLTRPWPRHLATSCEGSLNAQAALANAWLRYYPCPPGARPNSTVWVPLSTALVLPDHSAFPLATHAPHERLFRAHATRLRSLDATAALRPLRALLPAQSGKRISGGNIDETCKRN